jgi:hypothetical protein
MSTVLTGSTDAASTSATGYGAIIYHRGAVPEKDASTETIIEEIPPLGVPLDERRFWFQRARAYDPDAIATLVRLRICSSRLSD